MTQTIKHKLIALMGGYIELYCQYSPPMILKSKVNYPDNREIIKTLLQSVPEVRDELFDLLENMATLMLNSMHYFFINKTEAINPYLISYLKQEEKALYIINTLSIDNF